MSNYYGSGILFGLESTAATLTGLGSLSLAQSQEVTIDGDEELIKNNVGLTKTVVKYDNKSKATLEFIPTSGTATGTVSVTAWPTPGSTLALTDATFTPVGQTWIVDGVTLTRGNTRALMARISLSRYIDGAVPA